MRLREQVLQDALALAAEDRAYVADQLEQTLETRDFASPEVASAWTREIERRVASFDRGEIPADDADAVLARMRRYLAERKNQKAIS